MSEILKIVINSFQFTIDGNDVNVSILNGNNESRFIFDDLFTILEIMNVCSEEEFKTNAEKPKYMTFYEYNKDDITIESKIDPIDKTPSYDKYTNPFSIRFRRVFGGIIFYRLLQTFKEEGWYSKVCGKPSEEKVKQKLLAIEEFKQLSLIYHKSIPKLTPEWTQIIEEMEKIYNRHSYYHRRVIEFDITQYHFILKVKGFVECILDTIHEVPKRPVWNDLYEDGGSLVLQGGNRSKCDPQEFIDYVLRPMDFKHGIDGVYSFKNPGQVYIHPKKDNYGLKNTDGEREVNYAYEAGNIEELEKACDERLQDWNPDNFDVPDDFVEAWNRIDADYVGFYYHNDLLENMYRDIKLFDLLKDHKIENENPFHYSKCPGYDEQVKELIREIESVFEEIWDYDEVDSPFPAYRIEDIVLKNFIMTKDELEAWKHP